MKYKITITSIIEIETENVMIANKLAKRISLVSANVVGSSKPKNNKERISYRVSELEKKIKVEKVK